MIKSKVISKRALIENYIESLGDVHNGFPVFLSEIDNELLVCKSREVAWEVLFCSRQSQIKKNFQGIFDDSIFGLYYVSLQDGLNVARLLNKDNGIKDPRSFLKSFVELVIYASMWGIGDCHYENVIIVENKPTIVDAECVFSNHLSPTKSFLLPSHQNETRGNLTDLFTSLLSWDQFKSEWDYFMECVVHALQNHEMYWNAFQNCQEPVQNYGQNKKIRILLRDTGEYAGGFPKSEFSLEEKEQLRCGRIPYFYLYFDKFDQIFYDVNGIQKSLSVNSLSDYHYENFLNTKPSLSEVFFSRDSFYYRFSMAIADLLNWLYLCSEGGEINFVENKAEFSVNETQLSLKFCGGDTTLSREIGNAQHRKLTKYFGREIKEFRMELVRFSSNGR